MIVFKVFFLSLAVCSLTKRCLELNLSFFMLLRIWYTFLNMKIHVFPCVLKFPTIESSSIASSSLYHLLLSRCKSNCSFYSPYPSLFHIFHHVFFIVCILHNFQFTNSLFSYEKSAVQFTHYFVILNM